MNPLNYVFWYYLKAPLDILKIWSNFLRFFWKYFLPIPELFKTLFKPWKRDITRYSVATRGLDLKMIFESIGFNLISRAIGFFIRLAAILLALLIEIFVLVFGVLFFLFWFVWPIFLIFSFFYFQKPVFLIALIFVLVSFIFYLNTRERSPEQMDLREILNQKWSPNIWARLGLTFKEIPSRVLNDPESNLIVFLEQKNIKQKDFETVLNWEVSEQKEKYSQKRFWQEQNLFSFKGLGTDWTYGYAALLEGYARPIKVLTEQEHLIDREEELKLIEINLLKSKQSNVLIIGEAGVGKMSLVQKFARMVESGNVSPNLAYRKVLALDLKQVLAGLNTVGQMEERIMKVLNQAKSAGNFILVIDNFHDFIGGSENLGERDLSHFLAPFLEGGHFQLIALTTYKGLHERIDKSGLMKFFEKVEVKELDKEYVKIVCQDSVAEIESRVPAKITVQAINEIVERSDLLITDMPFPEKAVDLMEETAIYVAQKTQDYFVMPNHVDQVLTEKTEVPIGQLESEEKQKLANLEEILHKKIIDQEQAVNDIASAMRRSRLELSEKRRPIGSFLFMGPTGVGKTETAKALAEIYFSSEERMNRFDMSEFQGPDAVGKMIGSDITGSTGLLTTTVKENPFSLLLLDEIEKADSEVLNLFLQVLDEGWITNAFGEKVNFRNQIIIATSNAGSELIRESIKDIASGQIDERELKQKLIDFVLKKGLFRPEFINRFDGVVVFRPLSKEHLIKIAELMLNSLKKRLEKQDLIFNFGSNLINKVAELGYDPENGARPMRRVIQEKLEDLIAKRLLNDKIQKKVPFEIKSEDI
ncbi:MAG: ATP-dependent Clp protease ATP-binding subunit [Patescibacteria group bacterium]